MNLRINISNSKDSNKDTRTLFLWLLLLTILTLVLLSLSLLYPNSIIQYLILLPFIVFIFVPKKYSLRIDDEEEIKLYKDRMVSLKYGAIKIVEFKTITTKGFSYIDTMIIGMSSGEKYYVSGNYKWINSNNDDYFKLKDYLLKAAEIENRKKKSGAKENIRINNSFLEFVPFISLAVFILFLIWLFLV